MEADVSSPGWWKAENSTLFNVIVGENGIIQEIFSYSSFGFVTLFTLLEIIGLYHPNNANIYDLYRRPVCPASLKSIINENGSRTEIDGQ